MSESLNQILKPQLQIELQNVSPPGILTTSAGYCFIEFDSHQLASSCFSLLSGAVVKVGWALDSNDMRRRKQDYKWDKYHFSSVDWNKQAIVLIHTTVTIEKRILL